MNNTPVGMQGGKVSVYIVVVFVGDSVCVCGFVCGLFAWGYLYDVVLLNQC